MRHDNSLEKLPLVDEDGRVTGCATRGECHDGSMRLHPVVHLHLFNPSGELFLQLRPKWKDIQPGRWDTAVGGHVDWGESVEEALRREVREEIGLTDFEPRFLLRYVQQSARERELVHVYRTETALAPRPSAELDGGRFFSRQEILARLGADFFTPNFEQEWTRLFGEAGRHDAARADVPLP